MDRFLLKINSLPIYKWEIVRYNLTAQCPTKTNRQDKNKIPWKHWLKCTNVQSTPLRSGDHSLSRQVLLSRYLRTGFRDRQIIRYNEVIDAPLLPGTSSWLALFHWSRAWNWTLLRKVGQAAMCNSFLCNQDIFVNNFSKWQKWRAFTS